MVLNIHEWICVRVCDHRREKFVNEVMDAFVSETAGMFVNLGECFATCFIRKYIGICDAVVITGVTMAMHGFICHCFACAYL